jgi:hypothetical protein
MTRMLKWITLLCLSHQAGAMVVGDGTRGGGNAMVADFFQAGDDILQALMPLKTLSIQGQTIDIAKLRSGFEATKIFAKDSDFLDLDGVAVDAINTPDENKIEFSSRRWDRMTAEQHSKLVIHEILGLNRIPDKAYELSRQIFLVAMSSTDLGANYGDSGETCNEKREFVGAKAKGLSSALFYSGIKPRVVGSISTYKAPVLDCDNSSEPFPDNLTRATCERGPKDATQALQITGALDSMGVYAEGTMGHTWWSAKDVVCTIDEGATSDFARYKCSLVATWIFGCP